MADPIDVPGLNKLLESCISLEGRDSDEVFAASGLVKEPFAALSPEVHLQILELLSRRDAANLRLASPCFRQLPQSYFHHLVQSEMPWVWEIESLQPRHIDWYQLWCLLFAADGDGGMDEKEREWKSKLQRAKNGLVEIDLEQQGKMYLDEDYASCLEVAIERVNRETEAKIKEGYDSGIWSTRIDVHKVLKGLRNRRRIYGDVQEILRRIEALNLKAG